MLNRILAGIVLAGSLACASCSMMHDDLGDCPKGLYVRFVYDYNTQRADMFKDHCGHVTLYVYDESGKKVAERTVKNTESEQPLAQYGYTMHFTPEELPTGVYRLQAVAMQSDWDATLQKPGAKFHRSEVTDQESLVISLDHAKEPVEGTMELPVSDVAPLDTLWHTLRVTSLLPTDGVKVPAPAATKAPYSIYPIPDQYVFVDQEMATYATVSLIRDTKHISVTIRQLQEPEKVHHATYDVHIVDSNAQLAHDNEVIHKETLRYTPYAQWTTRVNTGEEETGDDITKSRADVTPAVINTTAHYNLMCNRLMLNAERRQDATLVVNNRETGEEIVALDLPVTLANGRNAWEQYNWTSQQYLDREYDYDLDLLLNGAEWVYVTIRVNVLSWSKRIQHETL